MRVKYGKRIGIGVGLAFCMFDSFHTQYFENFIIEQINKDYPNRLFSINYIFHEPYHLSSTPLIKIGITNEYRLTDTRSLNCAMWYTKIKQEILDNL